MRFIYVNIVTIIALSGQITQIHDILISSKMNGVSIKIRSDSVLNPSQVTGWFNESTSWYYLTIHQAHGDTARLELAKLFYPINRIEVIRAAESLQIGFRMSIPVEQFEFYYSEDPPELLLALRFPISDVISSLSSERPKKAPNFIPTSNRKQIWVKAFYFMGAGLTGAGFLAGEEQKGWEVPMGIGMIGMAYVYENFIQRKKK